MTGAVLGRREVKVSMPARKEASTVLPDLASATIQPRSLCTSRSTSGPRASRLARPRERQHRILAGAFSHQRSQAAGVHGASVRPYSCIFMDLQLNCIMTVVQPRVCRRKGRSLRPAPSLARHSSSARSARGQSQSSVWHLPRGRTGASGADATTVRTGLASGNASGTTSGPSGTGAPVSAV